MSSCAVYVLNWVVRQALRLITSVMGSHNAAGQTAVCGDYAFRPVKFRPCLSLRPQVFSAAVG